MKILILSNWSDKIAELNAITAPNKLQYAERHGYEFENIEHPYEEHVKWLEIIRDRLGKYDVVMTVGCDVLFMNHRVKVEEMFWPRLNPGWKISGTISDQRVIIAREHISWWPINNDVMIWPNGHAANAVISMLIDSAEVWLKYPKDKIK
jgi:hypothetical protein